MGDIGVYKGFKQQKWPSRSLNGIGIGQCEPTPPLLGVTPLEFRRDF